jgi:phosphate starvation-inducible PhoH-like protein
MEDDSQQPPVGKRRGRKPAGRKMNEKEIMKEYAKDLTAGITSLTRSRSNSIANVFHRAEQLLVETSVNNLQDCLAKPKNLRQEEYVRNLKNGDKKIMFATGPAGTGKTMLACNYGLYYLLTGQYEKMIFTRPLIAVDEEIGFLPGTMEEKMAPWVRPMMDVLGQMITQKEIQLLMEEKVIEIVPLGFMRGRTFTNTWIVADEMQNSTINQMKMLTTRLGKGSRMIVTGDLEQCDLPLTRQGTQIENGLNDFLKRMHVKGCPPRIGEYTFEIEDVQREEVVKDVLRIYETSV